MKKITLLTICGLVVMQTVLTLATPTYAANDIDQEINSQLSPIRDVYGQDDIDSGTLPETVAQVIRILLGLLGIIFIVLILYAGFLWMTSAGNEDKISKAKKIMVAAIIGTAIVLAAYAITFFVIDALVRATGISSSGLD